MSMVELERELVQDFVKGQAACDLDAEEGRRADANAEQSLTGEAAGKAEAEGASP